MDNCCRVRIVGRNGLLNQLVAFALQAELSCDVEFADTAELPDDELQPVVLLVDDEDARAKASLLHLLSRCREQGREIWTALFDVDPMKPGVHDSVRNGVRGIFYSTGEVAGLISGVRLLLAGDVHIPTQILLDLAMNRGRGDPRTEDGELTTREREILTHLSTGATNEKIAEDLFISSHTVKTHVYNIFRKIRVTNRLQAILWATQNLREGQFLGV